MNIFILDECPIIAAQSLCDNHLRKMLLESAQMLCTAAFFTTAKIEINGLEVETNITPPYQPAYENHTCNVWARESKGNFLWLLEHALEISRELSFRFGAVHESTKVVEWVDSIKHLLCFERQERTEFCIAIKQNMKCRKQDGFALMSPVDKYRTYYKFDKVHLHGWTKRKNSVINLISWL